MSQPHQGRGTAEYSKNLVRVLIFINRGACVAAFRLARHLDVQFNKRTLKMWLSNEQGPKRTYAWLVIGKEDWYASD